MPQISFSWTTTYWKKKIYQNKIGKTHYARISYHAILHTKNTKKKCSGGGSNSRPSDYETDALPTELPKQQLLLKRNLTVCSDSE